ncbi:MAG: restriction endonuclease subunit S [Bulleidia sp.]|nr:restriction endonuclease subunit S [Bulleidia sp.]
MKVKDCVEILDDKRIPLSSSQREKLEKKYRYYGAQGVIDYVDDYIFDGEYILVAEDGNNLKSLNENIATWATGKFWVNNHAHILGPKKGTNLKYVYYLINNLDLRGYITGSAQPKLNQENLANIELLLPVEEVQNKVANILSAIDKQIENNNKINFELESMAKTIYDYWFLQFEFPNEEGKPYKSSGGKMVWCEELKREIPEGWRVGTLKDLFVIKNGKDHKQLKDGSIPVYGSGGIIRYVDKLLFEGESVLIPRKGTLNNIIYTNKAIWTVDTMFYTQFLNKHSAIYTYLSLRLIDFERLNTGTGVPSMTADIIYNRKILIPPCGVLKKFDNISQKSFQLIFQKENENEGLSSLRNFLLPMLMNGQVTFKDK